MVISVWREKGDCRSVENSALNSLGKHLDSGSSRC